MDVPEVYDLTRAEAEAVDVLAQKLVEGYGSPRHPSWYDAAAEAVPALPSGLLDQLVSFGRSTSRSALKLRGVVVDSTRCGPTPTSRRSAVGGVSSQPEEAQLALLASALGPPFAWRTIQDGAMVQDLMPIRSEREAQSGHGSVALDWHSEDGFHPDRCRYLVLLGIRNPDSTPTTIGSIADVVLPTRLRRVLAEPRFLIRPDPEHLRQLADTDPGSDALRAARQMAESPDPVAILLGDFDEPYLRVDAPYTEAVAGDVVAAEALDLLVSQLTSVQQDVAIAGGEVLLVDNYRAVHGRRAFSPRYDGTDRWLKRISVGEIARNRPTLPRLR